MAKRPPKPTLRHEPVARAVATRIVRHINDDDFFWEADEVQSRINEMTFELMRAGNPRTVVSRLWKNQPIFEDTGQRGGHPWGWEGIDEACREVADDIAHEELAAAVKHWMQRYQ